MAFGRLGGFGRGFGRLGAYAGVQGAIAPIIGSAALNFSEASNSQYIGQVV